MQRKLLAANWKMHLSLSEAETLTSEIVHTLLQHGPLGFPIVIAPPFPYLSRVQHQLKDCAAFALAAQNLHTDPQGAFTGEVSAPMLQSVGCQYVIVGHSERRQYFGETEELLAQKLTQALRHGLRPIYCIGETLAQREGGHAEATVEAQLKGGLRPLLDSEAPQPIVLAYEPVWAIGTGQVATPHQAQAMHAFIRQWLADHLGNDYAQQTPILYGGSVKPNNAAELFGLPDVDGGLVGGASLVSRDFVAIARAL